MGKPEESPSRPHLDTPDAIDWGTKRNIEFLRLVREEAHRTVDYQIQNVNEIDSKAARLLRVNLILLGIVLTGISISLDGASTATVASIPELLNIYTATGLVLLFGSTGVAGVTYTGSHVQAGMNRHDLLEILWNDYTDRENLEGLIESYGSWIERNYRVTALNVSLGSLTILLLVYAMLCLALGVVEAGNGAIPNWMSLSTILVVGLVTRSTGFVRQVRRFWELQRDTNEPNIDS